MPLVNADGDSTDPTVLASGSARYAQLCASCHAVDGTGGIGPSLIGIAALVPDRQFHLDIVANGGVSMPGFSDQLTPSEVDAVVSYVRVTF